MSGSACWMTCRRFCPGPALQPDDVLLLQLQLDGVLDGHDPLVVGDERGEDVEQGRLAGADVHFTSS
jgi:hypothetical protein